MLIFLLCKYLKSLPQPTANCSNSFGLAELGLNEDNGSNETRKKKSLLDWTKREKRFSRKRNEKKRMRKRERERFFQWRLAMTMAILLLKISVDVLSLALFRDRDVTKE